MGKFYPVMLELSGKTCVVVGGGRVALRKVKTLIENYTGIELKIIAPFLCQELWEICKKEAINHDNKITWVQKEYEKNELDGAFLVFACTDEEELNATIAREAKSRGMLVNSVAPPDESNFLVPASIKRGDFTISISTGGASPALAKKLREKLEEQFSHQWDKYIDFLKHCRVEIKNKIEDEKERKNIYYQLLEDDSLLNHINELNDSELKDFSIEVVAEYLKKRREGKEWN